MVWWLALSPHSKKAPGWNLGWGRSLLSLHVLPMHLRVLPGSSGFLPPSKNMCVGSVDDSMRMVVCLIC